MSKGPTAVATPKSAIYGNQSGRRDPFDVGSDYDEHDVEKEMLFGAHKMWSVSGDAYFPCEKTEKRLPAGQYIPSFSEQRGVYFIKKAVNLDELLVLPDSMTTYVHICD